MSDERRRMIEYRIPLAEVNQASSKEKKHPRRHVELIHQWPARRPRSAARVAIAAALLSLPDDPKEVEARLGLLRDLAPYQCATTSLEQARALILEDYGGRAPRVLDPFAGGGAIPLEAANLGCEAHAVELNPVAHIIELATCVYPQTYGPRLAELVDRWGKRVLDRARRELADLYPTIPIPKARQREVGAPEIEPLAYLWTRTVPCVDRGCGAAVPLVRQTWLCRKKGRSIALRFAPDRKAKRMRFEIVSATSEEGLGFDPAAHSQGGDADCPFCTATVKADRVKEYGREGRIGTQLMAVVGLGEKKRGRIYLSAEEARMPAEEEVERRLARFGEEWPGPAALRLAPEYTGGSCVPYGLDRFEKLFTPRQAVALLTFSRAIREAHSSIVEDVGDPELARAVTTYLALTLDKLAGYSSTLTIWDPEDQVVKHTFGKQALPMVWDFAEVNPFGDAAGSFGMNLKAEVEAVSGLAASPHAAFACVRCSSTEIPYEEHEFDAVVTDPPYYDNISYADLSDFFYIWLKRTIAEHYPEHLSTEQTPKKKEATVTPYRHGDDDALARKHFDDTLTRCFLEAGRVLKPGGPLIVVYAHRSIVGWSTLIDALRKAECLVSEAWPLATESKNKWGSSTRAAMLITSIFLVARKRTESTTCDDYDDLVLPEARRVIEERVTTLWRAGISGADLVVAVVGAALGPFTRFARVRRANGKEVSTAEFLEEAQRMALDSVFRMLVQGADLSHASVDPVSRLYAVARAQFGDAAVEYDVFKNLAIGALPPGTEIDGMRDVLFSGKRALLEKQKSKVRMRSFDDRGKEPTLGLPDDGRAPLVIDVLHRLLWLQQKRPAEIGPFLRAAGVEPAAIRVLAQALGGRPLRSEPRPGASHDTRSIEERAIDTLLASFRDVERLMASGPLASS